MPWLDRLHVVKFDEWAEVVGLQQLHSIRCGQVLDVFSDDLRDESVVHDARVVSIICVFAEVFVPFAEDGKTEEKRVNVLDVFIV